MVCLIAATHCRVMKNCTVSFRKMLLGIFLAATACCCHVFGVTPGLSSKPSTEQKSVSVDEGHMVPYEQQIPGTAVSFEMLPIPAGEFIQGSNKQDAPADETPPVKVKVSPFWIGKCEVTWAEYKHFMQLCSVFEEFEDQGIRKVSKDNLVDAVTAPSKLYDPSFTFQAGEDPRQPAVSMSQFAAKQYTKWLSLLTGEFYRLPTESEWEYACRAGNQRDYYFGDDASKLEKYAWFEDNADFETHLVGQKLPNAWGLHDMLGNASEWVIDEYQEDWYQKLQGRLFTTEETICWPTKLFPRVLRGGSINSAVSDCRSAIRRGSNDDDLRSYDPNTPKSPWWFASDEALDIGFRIVKPLEVPTREEQEKYWQADVRSISRDANKRIFEEGRGERGLVDPQLPKAINDLESQNKGTP